VTLLERMPFAAAWLAADLERPDAATVTGRLAMYRLLVERVGPGELSPFWGYAAQLVWQSTSGRLGGEVIAAGSWWGACNFALSAIPYAAASELRLVPDAHVDVSGYEPALPLWHAALRALAVAGPHDDLEPARFAVWRAHLASIELAVARHAPAYAALPADERAFASGWIRMVDLFGAAALRTDLAYLAPLGPVSLPSRMLGDRDDLADLTRHERSTARRTIALGARPPWRWPIELAVWRRMMRRRDARDQLDVVLGGLFGPSLRRRLRALAYAF
jgi:hypothetical protein